ncbi:hypothetical protein ACGFIV_32260 [Sphaerisporangium sp. NPDC049003]|uniref:hypothetical protein n=1 Tax=Sphaerisporangium sp. NPDC049003 TaxID=3364517 RepID=UPI0037142208
MGQRTTSRRAAALRKAREAKAARDTERLTRERQIEAALADFFEFSGRAEQIRQEAGHRAKKILDYAEREARQADIEAGEAVRALRKLDQTNAEIAELCGLSVPVVRAMANSIPGDDPGDDPGDQTGELSGDTADGHDGEAHAEQQADAGAARVLAPSRQPATDGGSDAHAGASWGQFR